jgi:hypothetical protein
MPFLRGDGGLSRTRNPTWLIGGHGEELYRIENGTAPADSNQTPVIPRVM